MRQINYTEALLKLTGHPVELKGDELYFLNTTRADTALGSCSINTKTGAFLDRADPSFKGRGLPELEKLLGVKGSAISPPPTREKITLKKQPQKTVAAPLTGASAIAPMDMHPQLGMASQHWEYKTAGGKGVTFVVSRFDNEGVKETRPQSWSEEKQSWIWQFPEGVLPVFNLDAITAKPDATVLVCEGEKAAQAAQAQFPDMVVTTSSKGANNAHKSDWSVLSGRDVIICPDADKAGTEYACAVVGEALVHGASSLKVKDTLKLGWGVGDDLADHMVGADFLDDAQAYDSLYKPRDFEGDVVEAAAALSRGDCERETERLAKALGLSKVTFKGLVKEARLKLEDNEAVVSSESDLVLVDPEPWLAEVDGRELFKEIVRLIHRHVILKPEQATTTAAWVFYSYVFDRLRVAPILMLTSATKRCGKSTLMELVSGLVSRSLSVANISAASIYRVIEAAHPTLLIDEADTFLSAGDEIAGILNSGHTKAMAFVVRIEKNDLGEMTPKKFSTFCPKLVGMIGLPKSDALLDRCVMIRLERAVGGASILPLPPDVFAEFLPLRQKLVRWAQDHAEGLALNYALLPRGSNDRAQNNWSVLASVTQKIHPSVLEDIEKAYAELGDAAAEVVEDAPQNLLEAIFEVAMRQLGEDGFRQVMANPHEPLPNNKCLLISENLVVELNKLKHESWVDQNNGAGLTVHRLGKMLKPFGLKADRGRIKYENPKRGYRVAVLIPIWQRYGVGLDVLSATSEGATDA
jgi:putative DNA primase/helicase